MDISALVEGMSAGVLDYTFDDLKEVHTELVNRRMSSRYMGIVSGLMRDMIEQGKVEDKPIANNSAEEKTAPLLQSATLQSATLQPTTSQSAPTSAPTSAPLVTAATISPKLVESAPKVTPVQLGEESVAVAVKPFAAVKHSDVSQSTVPKSDVSQGGGVISQTPVSQMPKTIPPVGVPSVSAVRGSFPSAPTKRSALESDNESGYSTLEFLVGFYKVLAWLLVGVTLGVYAYVSIEYLASDIIYVLYAGGAAIVVSMLMLLICFAASENVKWKLNVDKALNKMGF